MLHFIKRNKTISLLLFITIISIISGIIISATLDNQTKTTITTNINNILNNIPNHKVNIKDIINQILVLNNIIIIIIWLLGISIIGLPINTIIYILKIITLTIEVIFLLKALKVSNIFLIIIYIIPKLLNIFLIFFLIYYSYNFSLILYKLIFKNKQYNINILGKKYLKILFIILLINSFISTLDIYIIPKILSKII